MLLDARTGDVSQGSRGTFENSIEYLLRQRGDGITADNSDSEDMNVSLLRR